MSLDHACVNWRASYAERWEARVKQQRARRMIGAHDDAPVPAGQLSFLDMTNA